MLMLTIHFLMLTLIIASLSALCVSLSMKLKHDREKYSVFECGFDLLSELRLPFSLNFYFVIIIFLIFDVELTLIIPFIFNMKFLKLSQLTVMLFGLFIVLIVGFVYEWVAGLLNWLI